MARAIKNSLIKTAVIICLCLVTYPSEAEDYTRTYQYGQELRNSLVDRLSHASVDPALSNREELETLREKARLIKEGESIVLKTPALETLRASSSLKREALKPEASLYLPSGASACTESSAILVKCQPDNRPPKNTCLITHSFASDIIAPQKGALSIKPCTDGDSCFELWLGNKTDNSLDGNCTIFTEILSFTLKHLPVIKAIVISDVYYDDYWQLHLSVQGKPYKKLLALPNDNFPPETEGACELGVSNVDTPNFDILPYIKASLVAVNSSEAVPVSLKQRVSVTGRGEGYVRLKLYFEPLATLTEESYGNLECLNQFKEDPQGPELTASCLKRMPTENNCTTSLLWPVCLASFTKPFAFSGGLEEFWDPFCLEQVITASYESSIVSSSLPSCSILGAYAYCTADLEDKTLFYCHSTPPCSEFNKEISCEVTRVKTELLEQTPITTKHTCTIQKNPNNKGVGVNSCANTISKDCKLLSSQCLGEENLAIEECSTIVNEYSCTAYKSLPNTELTTSISCPDFKCMGTECTKEISSNVTDITATALQLQVLQYMQDDFNCVGLDGSQTVACNIFAGTTHTCREGYYGKMKCCDAAGTVDVNDYVRLTSYMMSLKTALGAAGSETASFGSWASSELVNSSQGLISSSLDSTIASLGEESASTAAQTFTQEITKKLADYVARTFGEEVKNQLFSEGASTAGGTVVELNPQLVACAQGVMAAYVAYQAAKLIIAIVTACKPEEIETSIKIGLNSCSYQGSSCIKSIAGHCVEYEKQYCCYSSPLARIVMNQLKEQGQLADVCKGIPLEEFSRLDLSHLDLSEWRAYLEASDLLPNGEYSLDSLTGSGSVLNTSDRPDSAKRTLEHLSKPLSTGQ